MDDMNNPTPQALGISGRIAALFQSAQITPLLALVAFLLGVFAVMVTPREEEPQINVTMANVLIPFLYLVSYIIYFSYNSHFFFPF